jgi:hypothetical protein
MRSRGDVSVFRQHMHGVIWIFGMSGITAAVLS